MEAYEFQECLRIVYCMGQRDFVTVWGDDLGEHLWSKFVGAYGRSPSELIVNLDTKTMQTLMNYFLKRINARNERNQTNG